MASLIKFTATKLSSKGKQGVIVPDADGYRTMIVGGLNAFNSAGEFYVLDGAKQLFESSSSFMRRIQNGCLKGEVGHPKPTPGMSATAFMDRVCSIDEPNVCVHFKEIWLDPDYKPGVGTSTNPGIVPIMAKLKPSGAKGPALEAALSNPNENVCFSIRALTRDTRVGRVNHRTLVFIQTFDWVNEPGISIANQWDAPALEAKQPTEVPILDPLYDQVITRHQLEQLISRPTGQWAMEHQDVYADLRQIVQAMDSKKAPKYKSW
jgi:hypothetical protein